MTPGWRRMAAAALKGLVVFVVQDGVRAARRRTPSRSFTPDVPVLTFPAWDCLPYDRMSPSPDIESQRLATLAALARRSKDSGPAVVVTTVNAIAAARAAARRRSWARASPPRWAIRSRSTQLARFLANNGYARAGTVREPGDFAVRGGIVDLWPPGFEPLRLDFFGDRAGCHPHLRCGNAAVVRRSQRDRTVARQRSAAGRGGRQPLPRRLCRGVRSGGGRSAV